MSKYYNTSLRNLEYRLRAFKEDLPKYLEKAIMDREEEIVAAVANKQLYNRGINGAGVKIMSYQPYTATTRAIKQRKHQPATRVTLRDTGAFHAGMHIVYERDGFYITSSDLKTEGLVEKYGPLIFRLTDANLTRLLRGPIRKALQRRIRQAARVAKYKANYEKKYGKINYYKG